MTMRPAVLAILGSLCSVTAEASDAGWLSALSQFHGVEGLAGASPLELQASGLEAVPRAFATCPDELSVDAPRQAFYEAAWSWARFKKTTQAADLVRAERQIQRAVALCEADPSCLEPLRGQLRSWHAGLALERAERLYAQGKLAEAAARYALVPDLGAASGEILWRVVHSGEVAGGASLVSGMVRHQAAKLAAVAPPRGLSAQVVELAALSGEVTSRSRATSGVAVERSRFALTPEGWRQFLDAYAAAPFLDYTPYVRQYGLQVARSASSLRRPAKVLSQLTRQMAQLAPSYQAEWLKALWRHGHLEHASRLGRQILGRFPLSSNPLLADVAYDLGRILEEAGQVGEATKLWGELEQVLRGTRYEEEVLYRRAWLQRVGAGPKKLKEAAAGFSRYLERFPAGKYVVASRYHALELAHASAPAAVRAEAQRKFVAEHPLTYYGTRLAERLGLALAELVALAQGHAAVEARRPAEASLPSGSWYGAAYAKYRLMHRWGLRQEAQALLTLLDSELAPSREWNTFLLPVAVGTEQPSFATLAALRLYRAGVALNEGLLAGLYPDFEPTFLGELTRGRPFDLHLVRSLIRQESAFRSDAKSSAGALGLMQLMPASAAQVAQRLGIKPPLQLSDPKLNMKLGTELLHQLWNKYDGKLPHVLAAYNAGELVTDRWIARAGKLPLDEFSEFVPYLETREYIQLIERNLYFYRQLFPQPTASVQATSAATHRL